MAKRVSLATLRSRIRERGEWRAAYISNNVLDSWINEASYKFYSLMASYDPLRYVKKEWISITAGTRIYDLPSDFFKSVNCAVEDATTDGYSIIEPFSWDERYDVWHTATSAETRYLILGNQTSYEACEGYGSIELQPTPTWSGTLQLDYIPTFTDLESDENEIDTINGIGLNWIICDVAVKCCAKEETDPSIYLAQKKEAQEILQLNAKQDIHLTKTIYASNTLGSLILAIRNRGNWKHDQVTNAQLTEWINSSISEFVDTLTVYEANHFLEQSDVSVVSDTKSYDLPSDFLKVVGVAVKDSSSPDGYYVMERYNWDERYDYKYSSEKYTTRYMIRGKDIHLHPTPSWSGTIRVEYIKKPTTLTQMTDTHEFYNNWQEYVILDVAIKCCALLKQDPSIFITQFKKTDKRIRKVAKVDIAKPVTIVDVRRRNFRRYY